MEISLKPLSVVYYKIEGSGTKLPQKSVTKQSRQETEPARKYYKEN